MRSLKTKAFARFAKREGLSDASLCRAVDAMERGAADANLGGGVVKQRIARAGHGKSGGYRAIVLYRRRTLAVFAFGYAKSSRSDIDPIELAAFRALAKHMLAMSDDGVDRAVETGALEEVPCDDEAGQAIRK